MTLKTYFSVTKEPLTGSYCCSRLCEPLPKKQQLHSLEDLRYLQHDFFASYISLSSSDVKVNAALNTYSLGS